MTIGRGSARELARQLAERVVPLVAPAESLGSLSFYARGEIVWQLHARRLLRRQRPRDERSNA
jgi:hypothetical protein